MANACVFEFSGLLTSVLSVLCAPFLGAGSRLLLLAVPWVVSHPPPSCPCLQPLHVNDGVVVTCIGTRYAFYCATIGRTFFFNPSKQQEAECVGAVQRGLGLLYPSHWHLAEPLENPSGLLQAPHRGPTVTSACVAGATADSQQPAE